MDEEVVAAARFERQAEIQRTRAEARRALFAVLGWQGPSAERGEREAKADALFDALLKLFDAVERDREHEAAELESVAIDAAYNDAFDGSPGL